MDSQLDRANTELFWVRILLKSAIYKHMTKYSVKQRENTPVNIFLKAIEIIFVKRRRRERTFS